ncbi:putative ABC transport system permease protein [Humitalea rosea]|uniref:Putative ABC transport system permease protein n=1 Tax=Humitalea rosea TaxID=990373 RepID=A0A2W7IIT6_9PROT|nr:FtsX-like permease family protein [Humitalea rosea]PZW46563.1 putative ABC transport system permease protein [Humitalea rosea]
MRALRLALADLRHEPAFTLCSVLALAAVIAPLILLAGLRAGVIAGMAEDMGASPRAREIVNTTNLTLSPDWFTALAARPEVGFLIPRTRLLAATGRLEAGASPGHVIPVEVLPTAPGDPLLRGVPPPGPGQVVISTGAAQRLGVGPGDALRLRVILTGAEDIFRASLTVAAIAPPSASARDAIFAEPALGRGIQDFIDRRAAGTEATTAEGFRLYARRLEDVPVLVARLRAENIETASRAEDVAALLALDRNLTAGVAVIAAVGGAGFVLGLAAALWASVERKRRTLALLRLMGMRRAGLVMLPVWQALVFALLGTLVAAAVAQGAASIVNRLALLGASDGRDLARIGMLEVGGAGILSMLAAMVAAVAAARRAAAIDPAEGLRDA